MNNRYLFRAKRIDNGEWAEGYYTYYPHGFTSEDKMEHTIRDTVTSEDCNKLYFVDPNTICQCTGLKDKNGKLIWENDIMVGHLDDMYPENATYVRVMWHNNGFCTHQNGYDDFEILDEFDRNNFEVCGNIFDNTELLELD
ncbi:MAG: YopX family protein [Lachnospiraceae bacterium]